MAENVLNAEVGALDERCLLLEEVSFKWLMAGRKCWIDLSLFRNDPSYAARYLKLAEESDSLGLRKCAATLEARNGKHQSNNSKAHDSSSKFLVSLTDCDTP